MPAHHRKKKTSSASATTAAKSPRKKNVLSTSPAEQYALDDARNIAAFVAANRKPFRAFDAKRKAKLLPDAAVTGHQTLIRNTSTAMSQHKTQTAASAAATAQQAALRTALITQVKKIRDIVSLAHPGNAPLAKAFGVARRISAHANGEALAVSADQQNAFSDATFGPLAASAGITPGQINELASKRRALSSGMATGAERAGTKSGERAAKDALVRALKKSTTRLRKVSLLVFAGNARMIAKINRRPKKPTVKSRKASATGAPASTPAAGATK